MVFREQYTSSKSKIKLLLNVALYDSIRLVAFNFFEREYKNIIFHFCQAQSLLLVWNTFKVDSQLMNSYAYLALNVKVIHAFAAFVSHVHVCLGSKII